MDLLDQYKITRKIDAGGMATVFKATQISLHRPVAIKVLQKKVSKNREVVKRFNRESLIIARLSHPNIIHVIDRGITAKGMPFFVMEFVEGTDLSKLIREDQLSIDEKLDVTIQACKAFSYAHKNGVIHRDIKPANILIDKEQNIKISDFGIAQFFDQDMEEADQTQEGFTMGSPAYMSPEQKSSFKDVTAKSDIYSFGVVIYELFTRKKPLGNFKPPSQINPQLNPALDEIVLKCLEPDPEDRYSTVDEIKDLLLGILRGAHIKDSQKQKAIQGIPKMADIFELLDVIREHQFAAVYLIRHKQKNQLMIAKRYSESLGGYKEAQLLTKLNHKNIVALFGVAANQGVYIVVMEYLSGGSMKDRMVRSYEWADALQIIIEVALALEFAHKNRIIHGNLRPSNILFTDSGEIKITDFGLAEHYSGTPEETNWYNVAGMKRSNITDIYAIGTILYEMILGEVPKINANKFKPSEAFNDLPENLTEFIQRLLLSEHESGFANMTEVVTQGQELLVEYEEEMTLLMERESRLTYQLLTAFKNNKLILIPMLMIILCAIIAAIFFLL